MQVIHQNEGSRREREGREKSILTGQLEIRPARTKPSMEEPRLAPERDCDSETEARPQTVARTPCGSDGFCRWAATRLEQGLKQGSAPKTPLPLTSPD